MKNFARTLRLFSRDVPMVIVVCLVIVSSLAYILIGNWTGNGTLNSDAIQFLYSTLSLSVLFFILMMFLSYEYFAKAKAVGLGEVIAATRSGRFRLYGRQFGVMTIVSVLLTAGPMVINVYYYFYQQIGHAEYLLHIIVCILLYLTGVMVVGTLLGMCASLMKTRVRAYVFIVIVALLVSPAGQLIAVTITELTDESMFAFYYPFAITPLEMRGCENSFGFTVQAYHVARLLFWMVLLGGFLLWKLRPQGKKAAVAAVPILLACAVVCAVIYALPSSKVIGTIDLNDGFGHNSWYYNRLRTSVEDSEKNPFQITEYKLELKIRRLLDAKVSMAVSDPVLEEYPFTLYHRYKVHRVTDGAGNELPFRQEGDSVTVQGNGAVDRIVMEYAGYSADCYSNAQGVMLPGWFAYYPYAGYHSLTTNRGVSMKTLTLEKPVLFQVQADMDKPIYSNLKQTGTNTFEGVTDGVTLVSGFFDVFEKDGFRIVYPYLSYLHNQEELEKTIDINRANGILNERVKTIFITGSASVNSDHILSYTCGDLTELVNQFQLTGDQVYAGQIVMYYQGNYEGLLKRGEDQIRRGFTDNPFAIMIGLLEQTRDPDALITAMEKYSSDTKDERTFKEFAEDWLKGEESNA